MSESIHGSVLGLIPVCFTGDLLSITDKSNCLNIFQASFTLSLSKTGDQSVARRLA
jgi:hypothetical protein